MKNIIKHISALLFFTLGSAKAATTFMFNQMNYNFVTASETKGYTVTVSNGYYSTTTGSEIAFTFNNPNTGDNWTVAFAAVLGQPLAVGLYTDAVRYPFNRPFFNTQGKNGMDFSGNGAGSNTSLADFTVLEIERNPDGSLAKFSVDFNFYSEGYATWFTKGTLRFNSNIPLGSIPEPGAPILILFSFGLFWRRRR